jgi:hypothetical protein
MFHGDFLLAIKKKPFSSNRANTSVCGADALPRRFDEADKPCGMHDIQNHRGASASATHEVSTTQRLTLDAVTTFVSRHIGSQPAAFSITRLVWFKNKSLIVLAQNFCLLGQELSEQPRCFATPR